MRADRDVEGSDVVLWLWLWTWWCAALAADLDALRAQGTFLWAADAEGGGPYIFPKPDDPSVQVGFEVDLAQALGRRLQLTPIHQQGQWDLLLDLVSTRKADIVLNGYEWRPEHARAYAATVPYFVYGLQLLSRQDDPDLHDWDDLPSPPAGRRPYRLGVLGGTAAQSIAEARCKDGGCEVIAYDGNTEAMREVETGKLDATIADTPCVSFYLRDFPGLAVRGATIEPGYYVMYVHPGDAAFLHAVNDALLGMIRDGELERILRTWSLWDDQQEALHRMADQARFFGYQPPERAAFTPDAAPAAAAPTPTDRPRGLAIVTTWGPALLGAAGVTVVLSCLSFPLAIAVGLLVAVGRLYGPAWLRPLLTVYVEFLRGTPLMLQLYFIFFVLPEVGVNVPAFATAVLGLAINYSAYESEIYRAGLQAVPPGQMEAALSLGMTRTQALRHVVVPQAVRIVIPPVVNDFIALFKDTSVCSVITLVELTKQFSILSKSTLAILEIMAMTAVLYLLMSYPLSRLARHVEERLGPSKVGA